MYLARDLRQTIRRYKLKALYEVTWPGEAKTIKSKD